MEDALATVRFRARNMERKHKYGIAGCLVLILLWSFRPRGKTADVLNGYTSRQNLAKWQLEMTVGAFCMSPLPSKLMKKSETTSNTKCGSCKELGNFKMTGNIDEKSYSKGTIYALLYSFYAALGTVKSEKGVPYEFTFNTWGVSPTPGFPDDDPQRFGKAAYAGLAQNAEVRKYLAEERKKRGVSSASPLGAGMTVVEVGSGTGAGAHLIAGSLLPGAHYYALDMQAASTATCNRRHTSGRPVDGTVGTSNVTCVHVPKGVGNNQPIIDNHGKPIASNSVDIVVICETHIAATKIGPEEDAIFAEIHRVLAPGGLFVWGNALPTNVWEKAPIALTQHGFKQVLNENVTKGAVEARDLDAPRVNAFMESWGDALWVTGIFGRESMCGQALVMLVKNFYRHPGTALYNTMVSGHDSYMRQVYKKHGHDTWAHLHASSGR